jgi:hypothetical protein
VDVVLDDHLHAELHVIDGGQDHQQKDDGDQRVLQGLDNIAMRRSLHRNHQDHEEGDQEHIRNSCEALFPEMVGSVLGRAEAENFTERRAHIAHDSLLSELRSR